MLDRSLAFRQIEITCHTFNFVEPMIKLELLRTFVEVSQSGNIAEASAKLGRTSSAISMSLKLLETQIGGSLFETDRKNKLTPLGNYVLTVGRGELARYERAIRSISAFARNETGHVDIASVPSVALTLLPTAIMGFTRKFPSVEISLRDTDSAAVAAAVEGEACEIGIAAAPHPRSTVEFQPLFCDPYVAVAPKGHEITRRRRKLRAADFLPYPFISNGAAASIITSEFKVLAEKSKLVVHSVASLLAIVRAGAGITILPSLSVPNSLPDLSTAALEDSVPLRTVGLLSRGIATMTPAAKAFQEHFTSMLTDKALRARLGIKLIE